MLLSFFSFLFPNTNVNYLYYSEASSFLCKLSSTRLNKSNSNCYSNCTHSPAHPISSFRVHHDQGIWDVHFSTATYPPCREDLLLSEMEERVRITGVMHFWSHLHCCTRDSLAEKGADIVDRYVLFFHIYKTLIPPRWIRRNLPIFWFYIESMIQEFSERRFRNYFESIDCSWINFFLTQLLDSIHFNYFFKHKMDSIIRGRWQTRPTLYSARSATEGNRIRNFLIFRA